MKLLVLTTQKEIRSFVSNHHNTLLPKLLSIGDFLQRSIITDKILIPEYLRKIYFYEAAKRVDLARLGIPREFEAFLREGELIYTFLKETFLERVDFQKIDLSDTYAEFSEHLAIIAQIYENYKTILSQKGFVDTITLDDYRINSEYLHQFSSIEIRLQGYLTKFDREILSQIDLPLKIFYEVSPFNKPLAKKMFALQEEGRYILNGRGEVLKREPLSPKELDVSLCAFDKRVEQANFVFAKIEEFVRSGIDPDKIAVILPDESFKEYLEIFDRFNNLNFSMGESFIYSPLYIWLEKCKEEPQNCQELKDVKSFEELEDVIMAKATPKEQQLIQEELFVLRQIFIHTSFDLHRVLQLLIQSFSGLSFDDTRGGKITVMGVLESRGVVYDGVIVTDFNEGGVPKVSAEDLFLNSAIKNRANLPTLKEKESLQKHYYYRLFKDAKKVAISYVKDQQKDVSRFFYELPCKVQEERKERYKEVLYTLQPKPTLYSYERSFDLPRVLSPTSLQMLLKCPLRYYLQSIERVAALPQEYLGTKIHNAIAKALKKRPKSANEYGDLILQELFDKAGKGDIFTIKTQWEEKILAFAKRDFQELRGEIASEVTKKRALGEFLLQARADRIIRRDEEVFIYDYKTNNTTDYLKHYHKSEENLQAAFYSYIWNSEKVYFWDIYNKRLQHVPIEPEGAKEEIQKALERIETVTKRAQDSGYCRFCPYKFGCKGVA